MNARHSTYLAVRDAIGIALAVAVAGALAVTFALGGMHAAAAAAVSPARQACAAFAVWERHETQADLDGLVAASVPLGRSWLKADIGQVYADASSPSAKAGKYVKADRKYVTEDCAKL